MQHKHQRRGGFGHGWNAIRRWGGLLVVVCALLALTLQPVQALAYYFAVPKMTVDVWVSADGSVALDYAYDFQNQASGEPIEFVDIGMPTTSWNLDNAAATVDGQAVAVEKSTEISNGIAVNLGSRAIPSGQSGQVVAHMGKIERMLFKADAQQINRSEPYASFQFQPNYFGSQYVTGQTDMTVTLHLPAGMNDAEPIYFNPQNWPGQDKPESAIDANGSVYYRWHAANADSSSRYVFGAAFPARLVPESTVLTPLPAANFDFGSLCPWIFCLGFVGFMGLTIWGAVTGDKKRKLQYLPPKVSVEGNGIKRGLTAVEAAVLMGQPLDKILTMILFAVIKRGAAKVVSQNPMKLDIAQRLPEDMRTYETEFITAMAETDVRVQRRGLQDMMTNLVKSVSEKMRGFSRKETVTYYDDIMKKAWAQVEQSQTPEMKMQAFDDAMDWTMLDRDFEGHTQQTFSGGPVFVPMWWGNFNPGMGGGMASAGSSRPSTSSVGNAPPGGVSLPSLPGSTFAGSLVTGMQNFSNTVVGDLTAFTGGVTAKTNPPPPPSTSSRGGGGGGGGHSCACACACAGCACACAGGGR